MSEVITPSALREIIPARPGMLLLDKVFVENENKAVAIKSISMNEPWFLGHFPDHPIFPGVLQAEAASQLAEVLLWKRLDPERKGDFYLKALRQVKFRKPNHPGDRMLIELEVTEVRDDSADFSVNIRNSGGLASNMKGTVAVRPKEAPRAIIPEFNEFDKGPGFEMDTPDIMKIIPHRYPFLFVDYVSKIEGNKVTGVKNATDTEPIFRQYKDGYTVLCSALQPEIIAQVGAIYTLSRPENQGKIAYFMGIDSSDFYFPIFPGDQMLMEVEMPDFKSKFGKGEGRMIVNGEVASRTVMMFAIVDPIG